MYCQKISNLFEIGVGCDYPALAQGIITKHKISLNVEPSSEEQRGQVSRDRVWCYLCHRPAPAQAENICSQLKCNKTNHRLQRKLGRIRKSVHIKAMFDNELELRFVTLLMLMMMFPVKWNN